MRTGVTTLSTPPLAGGRLRTLPHEGRRTVRFRLAAFLLQVLFCILPATALLAAGRASLAGYYFWVMLGFMIAWKMLAGRRDEVLCLLLASAPFINLLRSFAFYNVIVALFGACLLYYMMLASGPFFATLRKHKLVVILFLFVGVYYLMSFWNTGQYSANLRMFEMVFTVMVVLILNRNPVLLGAALTGLIVSAWCVGIGMIPQLGSGARLGMVALEGQTLGNPTQLGVPLALAFVALVADQGRWLNLQHRPGVRLVLILVTMPLLALTTSRASWLIAAFGLLSCLVAGSRQRLKALLVVVLAAVAIQGVLLSPLGTSLKKGIERTFDDKRSVRQRTSGRSDQWRVAWYAVTREVTPMLFGYGPGRSPAVYAEYSGNVPGVKYAVGKKVAFHSLFMQIGVETGLIGLLILAVWLGAATTKAVIALPARRTLLPCIGVGSFFLIIVTVSGSDINSGVFLGIGLAGATVAVPKPAQPLPARRRAFRKM